MSSIKYCPLCTNHIPDDRIFIDTIICECGWTQQVGPVSREARNNRKVALSIATLGICLIASMWQIINWDVYSVSIVPLKVKQITGTADINDLKKILNICQQRSKHSCVEVVYEDLYSMTQDNEYRQKLGKLLTSQKKFGPALHAFNQYFEAGGQDVDARYEFAKLLGQTGQFSDSQREYQLFLKSKPGVFQVTVARSYIQLLIDHDKLKAAHDYILYYRRIGKNASLFMNEELKEIQKKITVRSASL